MLHASDCSAVSQQFLPCSPFTRTSSEFSVAFDFSGCHTVNDLLGYVHTNRVKSSPIQSRLTKMQQRLCGLLTMAAAAVRTHQQSRVGSNPVQSGSQRRSSDSVAYLQWPPRQCVHTNRVESSRVESHESCRVKRRDAACFIFVSQTLVIGRDGRN